MSYNLDGYIQVADRIKLFYAKHPEGSLQMDQPEFVQVEGKQWAIGRAYAYRTPEDLRPGVGTAWEIVPGTTNFTRGSELQNLETSAWGRAIGSLGIGIDASIATLDEVQQAKNRQEIMRTTEADPKDPWVTTDEGLSPLSLSPEAARPPKDSHSTGATTKGSSMYPATAPQLKAVNAILYKLEVFAEFDRVAKVNEWLISLNKDAVTSLSELDKHQCSLLIDHLQAAI